MPPKAVKVELLPIHIIVGLAEDVITGFAFTFIANVLVDEHPAAFVPVTV